MRSYFKWFSNMCLIESSCNLLTAFSQSPESNDGTKASPCSFWSFCSISMWVTVVMIDGLHFCNASKRKQGLKSFLLWTRVSHSLASAAWLKYTSISQDLLLDIWVFCWGFCFDSKEMSIFWKARNTFSSIFYISLLSASWFLCCKLLTFEHSNIITLICSLALWNCFRWQFVLRNGVSHFQLWNWNSLSHYTVIFQLSSVNLETGYL